MHELFANTGLIMSIHKLRALEYLVAVVDHGGFAAAGRRLGLAAPSVHRLVCALESELGIQLLDREATPIRPLPDAEGYVSKARVLVAEHRALDDSLRDRTSAPAGPLVVAGQSVAIHHVLADALSAFHEAYPNIRVELWDAGVRRDVNQLRADVLLTFGWPPPQDAIVRTLAHTRWLVVATPGFWKRHGTPQHPSQLEGLPCAVFRTPFGELMREWTFEQGREQVSVRVDGWLIGDDRRALDAPVLDGQLMARVNDLSARQPLLDRSLKPVLLDWVGQHAPPLNLLVRKAMARQPRVRAFVDFIAEHAKGLASQRLPAGMPPVPVAKRPAWFKRRAG
jgi:DNA-binding transcriptional LysR family regulator